MVGTIFFITHRYCVGRYVFLHYFREGTISPPFGVRQVKLILTILIHSCRQILMLLKNVSNVKYSCQQRQYILNFTILCWSLRIFTLFSGRDNFTTFCVRHVKLIPIILFIAVGRFQYYQKNIYYKVQLSTKIVHTQFYHTVLVITYFYTI